MEAENTVPAFEVAMRAGADVVELDVRMTSDDVAVVMHDPDVDRTTDGWGLVRSATLSELKRLTVETSSGDRVEIPTLEEALRCLSGRAAVDVEIKNVPGEPDFEPARELAVEATLRAVDRTAFVGTVLISSFNPLSIARALELEPDVVTGLLVTEDVDPRVAFSFAREQGHSWVLPHVSAVLDGPGELATEVHGAGMSLGAWITDDPTMAVTLFRAGLDAVATNDPAAIVAARHEAFG